MSVSFRTSYRKCQKVLGKNMDLWENEVYRFKTIGQLKVCYSDVPHTETDNRLPLIWRGTFM